MNKKTIFSGLLIIIVVAALTWFIMWSKKSNQVNPEPNENAEQGAVSESPYLIVHKPEMVSVAEDSFLFGIGGSYPKFTQAPDAFNKKIADTIIAGTADFKETANADYKARLETGGADFEKEFSGSDMYTYQVDTNVIQSNDRYISAVIRFGGYSGGAHGYQNIVTFNYDVKNKKELSLTDFISLAEASDKSRANLEKKFAVDDGLDEQLSGMITAGTDPKNPENFQNFTFTNDDITIYFTQYQVAPYVAGEQTVVIPRD